MPMLLSVACDDAKCRNIQPFWFESESETFKDLLDTIISQGWGIWGGPEQPKMMFLCAQHKSKESPDGT